MNFPATLVCVSLAEWIQWIHQGAIYLHSHRFRNVSAPDDYETFRKLLLSAHDAGTSDDQSYLLATICDDGYGNVKFFGSAPFEFVVVPLESVNSFQVASDRGNLLLYAEAERLGVQLSPSVFDSLWRIWCREREAEQRLLRGHRLVDALGFERLVTPPRWLSILEDVESIPANRQDQLQKLERSSAFGFCISLIKYSVREVAASYAGGEELIGRAAALVDALRNSGRIEDFELRDSCVFKMASDIDRLTGSRNEGKLPPFLVYSSAEHFRHAFSESNIDSERLWLSFGGALSCIAASLGKFSAAECAFAVGCVMQDVAVSELLYAAYPERFPAISARALPFDPRSLVTYYEESAEPTVAGVVDGPSGDVVDACEPVGRLDTDVPSVAASDGGAVDKGGVGSGEIGLGDNTVSPVPKYDANANADSPKAESPSSDATTASVASTKTVERLKKRGGTKLASTEPAKPVAAPVATVAEPNPLTELDTIQGGDSDASQQASLFPGPLEEAVVGNQANQYKHDEPMPSSASPEGRSPDAVVAGAELPD